MTPLSQAKKQGLCDVGDQVVVSQCPSALDRGIVKVRRERLLVSRWPSGLQL